jgi:hypothetical protein
VKKLNNSSDFYNEMLLDVRSASESLGEYPRDAFTNWSLERLSEANELSDLTIAPFQGTARNRKRMALDAYGFDELDGTFMAVVTDFSDSDSMATITRTEIEALFGQVRAFIENCLDLNEFRNFPSHEESVAAGQLVLENRGSINKFRIYLVSNRELSSRVKQLDADDLDGKQVAYTVWDMNRFLDAYASTQGREEISIDFTEWYPTGIPVLPATSSTPELLGAYLAIVRGDVLAGIFEKYGSRLLEGNVRSFLSARGAVNKGIRLSLLNNPDKFLAFNNGITATATSVVLRNEGLVGYISEISDLQIVNGGQTTASMHDFLKKERDSGNLKKANVQMKLLVVKPEASNEMVPQIARFSNSQNKVSEADFFSNSSFHRKFEELSKRIMANPKGGSQISTYWFYERARGSYANERSRAANAKQFDLKYPKAQVITKTDLAKFHNSWNQLPHKVSDGAQKNFLAFANAVAESYSANELKYGERFFKQSICQAILFKELHKNVMKSPWYGGYAANIVTYALSKFSHELTLHGLALDWDLIWKNQTVSDSLMNELLLVAQGMLAHLTSPTRTKENVTEWAKDQNSWKLAKEVKVNLSLVGVPEVRSFDAEREKNEAREDRVSGVMVNVAQKMSFIVNLDSRVLTEILNSPIGALRVSPREKASVNKLLTQKVLTSDRDYEGVYDLLVRAISEGHQIPDLPR